jgi:hypothetical protein
MLQIKLGCGQLHALGDELRQIITDVNLLPVYMPGTSRPNRSYLGNWSEKRRNGKIKTRQTMHRFRIVIALALFSCALMLAQEAATSAPQTARQALLEMFFSKTPGTLVKHLPAATLAAVEKSGALASLQQYTSMASQMQTQTQRHNLQTFETGSVLLSGEDAKTGEKYEINVENDALRGDQDDIELSFHTYKNGQPQRTPYMPQLTFSMKEEAHIWKLNEISVTIHLPLADPDLLKALTQQMKPQPVAQGAFAPTPKINSQPAGSDSMVISAMHTILAAETTYANTYKNVGYTCSLSSLDGFGGGEPNERQAMLINSGLASGKRFGFVFTVSQCSGAPATSFQLTAAPNANTLGRRAFCTDQTGAIRFSADGNPATCMTSGAPLQ